MIKCIKCNKKFEKNQFQRGKKYLGIDEHHNPPEFMFEKDERWFGEIINLCRKCHVELHELIRNIMFEHSNLFKKNNSDYWIWIKVLPCDRKKCREEIFNFTKEWIK